MDKIELLRKYIAVADMCKGTALADTPWICVKFSGDSYWCDEHPEFDNPLDDYEFAVAILEDKPVFVGDKIWLKVMEEWGYAVPESTIRTINNDKCSWTKQNRTFMLNGVEMPCPIEKEKAYSIRIHGDHFYFENVHDFLKVSEAIHTILHNARCVK